MGQWDLDVFHGRLPQDMVQKLMAFPPPLEHDGADSLGWNGTSHGGFTVSSAYASLTQGQNRLKVIGQPFGGGRDPEECRFLVGWWRMDDS